MIAAAMEDADGDRRADQIVLRYSERVIHALDRARFPFTVAGYSIVRVKVLSAVCVSSSCCAKR